MIWAEHYLFQKKSWTRVIYNISRLTKLEEGKGKSKGAGRKSIYSLIDALISLIIKKTRKAQTR